MQIRLRRADRPGGIFCAVAARVFVTLSSWAAQKARLRVDDYQIDAELAPHLHQISARAKVKFTALQDLNTAIFQLHNGLRVTKVLDEKDQPLAADVSRRIRPCARAITQRPSEHC
jgi:hypothetical protein